MNEIELNELVRLYLNRYTHLNGEVETASDTGDGVQIFWHFFHQLLADFHVGNDFQFAHNVSS